MNFLNKFKKISHGNYEKRKIQIVPERSQEKSGCQS
jgi:hypothetical protein